MPSDARRWTKYDADSTPLNHQPEGGRAHPRPNCNLAGRHSNENLYREAEPPIMRG
jgi:hypothetical protein